MPNAIIDFPKGMEFSHQQPKIEVIVKKNGKVIYHNKTYAVIMNMVQSITTMKEIEGDVELEGDSQVFGCGNAIIQMFALNELNRKLQEVVVQGALQLQQFIKDPVVFAKNAQMIKEMVEGK